MWLTKGWSYNAALIVERIGDDALSKAYRKSKRMALT
jgi:hypothetical protein